MLTSGTLALAALTYVGPIMWVFLALLVIFTIIYVIVRRRQK